MQNEPQKRIHKKTKMHTVVCFPFACRQKYLLKYYFSKTSPLMQLGYANTSYQKDKTKVIILKLVLVQVAKSGLHA